MNNAIFMYDLPKNEPILGYLPCSLERKELEKEIQRLSSEVIEIPLIIGGKEIYTGNLGEVVMPHKHSHVLATYHKAGEKEVKMAIDAALEAHSYWTNVSWVERMSVTLKIAELISKKYRALLNANGVCPFCGLMPIIFQKFTIISLFPKAVVLTDWNTGH